MIGIVAGALAAGVAVSEDRVAVIRGDVVDVVALADGALLSRWPAGRYTPRHVAWSGDRLAAWGGQGVLVWSDTRLEVATGRSLTGPVTPLGDGLLLEVAPWAPTWVDLVTFETQCLPDTITRVGEAELARCVPLPDGEHVACGGDPGPTCRGTVRTWAGDAVPLDLCEVTATTADGILGRDATGAWAWWTPVGVVALDLPREAEVGVGPGAFVARVGDRLEVVPRDGSARGNLALRATGTAVEGSGGVVVAGPFAAARLDRETGELLAGYPAERRGYAGLSAAREARFTRGADGVWRGSEGWTVTPRDGGVDVRRGWRRRALQGVWEPLDADATCILLARRQGRDQLVALGRRGVAWRRAVPEGDVVDARLVEGAVIVVVPGAVARLDAETGEAVWARPAPWPVREVLR